MSATSWQPAPLDELRALLSTPQLPVREDDMCHAAPAPLSFACLGACRNGGHDPAHRLPTDDLALRIRDASAVNGLEALLRRATQPPAATSIHVHHDHPTARTLSLRTALLWHHAIGTLWHASTRAEPRTPHASMDVKCKRARDDMASLCRLRRAESASPFTT